jgi:hypothetical protein
MFRKSACEDFAPSELRKILVNPVIYKHLVPPGLAEALLKKTRRQKLVTRNEITNIADPCTLCWSLRPVLIGTFGYAQRVSKRLLAHRN